MPELSLALSRVGDMFKFGRSTRMYILGGPAELMPEEGLTKKHMQAMKALEASPAHLLSVQCSCHPSARTSSKSSNLDLQHAPCGAVVPSCTLFFNGVEQVEPGECFGLRCISKHTVLSRPVIQGELQTFNTSFKP